MLLMTYDEQLMLFILGGCATVLFMLFRDIWKSYRSR